MTSDFVSKEESIEDENLFSFLNLNLFEKYSKETVEFYSFLTGAKKGIKAGVSLGFNAKKMN